MNESEVTCDDRTVINPENPATTTTITPTDPPILSSCHRTSHLFNEESGDHMKSYCILNVNRNYHQTEQACNDINMNLFVIDDSALQSSFFITLTSDLIAHPRGFVWINGQRNQSGVWLSSNPQSALLYDEIDWVQTDSSVKNFRRLSQIYSTAWAFSSNGRWL
ncbi:CLUMA_CG015587, isoform A [Clunio marinus]|uniref:CLUMA_CG015587, isoform A n=1 Tax=Clunio marinus TaxID=568069 RepID=A0A1J1IRX7_9DIPT|nr:CLUMA_CG015587, isoform A [Clunio marinus]